MTDPIDPDALHDPRDAAAYWFARELSGKMDETESRRFEAWRRAHPEHDLEYRRARGVWNAARLIPADRLRALAQTPAPAAGQRFIQRRRFALGLGAACAATVVAGIALPRYWHGAPGYTASFATLRGERRRAVLPDGSVVDLNTATTLAVRFHARRRVVVLDAGEAAFTVTPDAKRPFHVEAGDTSVRVTGTRFNVRRDGEDVRVAVESGAVEVRLGPWWDRRQAALRAGQGAAARAQNGIQVIDRLDIAAALAWRQGRVVFRDTPLSEAIAEINRYAPRPIRLGDPALAGTRIAGAFSTDDTRSFLDLLPDIAPVTVLRIDGTPVVARR